jgi:uncharacterized protein
MPPAAPSAVSCTVFPWNQPSMSPLSTSLRPRRAPTSGGSAARAVDRGTPLGICRFGAIAGVRRHTRVVHGARRVAGARAALEPMSAGTPVEHAVTEALEACAGVVSAYLFGSVAADRAHWESDIDLAVLLDRGVYPDAASRFDARLRLIGRCQSAVQRDVDLVVLNDAPPTLARHIMTTGRRCCCATPSATTHISGWCSHARPIWSRSFDGLARSSFARSRDDLPDRTPRRAPSSPGSRPSATSTRLSGSCRSCEASSRRRMTRRDVLDAPLPLSREPQVSRQRLVRSESAETSSGTIRCPATRSSAGATCSRTPEAGRRQQQSWDLRGNTRR